MLEYTDKYWKMLIPCMKKGLNKRYGKEYTRELIKKTDAEYRDMLQRADDVGADNPMASNMYECLFNTFARREGYLDVLPVMCDIDYLSAKLMHFNLNRKYTLASGGEVCDYWFIGDKMKNPQ